MKSYDFSKMQMPNVDIVEKYEAPAKLVATPHAPGMETQVEKPPMKVSWIPDTVPVTRENLLKALEVTPEEQRVIWSTEQRDPLWHLHRAGRLTGSRVGSACGMNKWCTPDQLVHEWLYKPVVMNAAMQHGIDNENPVRQMYIDSKLRQNRPTKQVIEFERPPEGIGEDYMHIDMDPAAASDKPYDLKVDVRGVVVHPKHPWIGYSSDGEATDSDDNYLIEIKCPRRPYEDIPLYYYAQIQAGMWLLNYKYCDFIVWTKEHFSIKRYAFNEDFWNSFMFPRMEDFYFNKFIPEAVEAIKNERAYNPATAKKTKIFHL